MTQPPVRRPAIRAISEDDAGAAIGRLLAVARSDTVLERFRSAPTDGSRTG